MASAGIAGEHAIVAFAPLLLALHLDRTGWKLEAIALLALCIGTTFVGAGILSVRATNILPRHYHLLRHGASPGVALGSCSPLLLLSGIAAVRLRSGAPLGPLRAHFWALLSCAVQPSLMLLLPLRMHRRAWLPLIIGHAIVLVSIAATRPPGHDLTITLACLIVHAVVFWSCVHGIKGSFTFGEAAAIAQALGALAADTMVMDACSRHTRSVAADLCVHRTLDVLATHALVAGGLGLAATLALMLALLDRVRAPPAVQSAAFVGGVAIALAAVLLPWLTHLLGTDAIHWLYEEFTSDGRPALLVYWSLLIPLASLIAALTAPAPRAESTQPPSRTHRARLLLSRKVFHFLVVAIFSPAIPTHPAILHLALAIALVGFVHLELLRLYALPPLAAPLTTFLAAFLDARDSGALVLTHTYLLLGCSIPIWLSSALPPPTAATTTTLAAACLTAAPHAGILVLGVGDAMASLVGISIGRVRWTSVTHKTLEGTAAGVAAMLVLMGVILHSSLPGGLPHSIYVWATLSACVVIACLLEALTDQIDNLFLPVAFLTALLVAAASDLR